jgi:hypothetical protein
VALAEAWTQELTGAVRTSSRTRPLGSPVVEIVLADCERFFIQKAEPGPATSSTLDWDMLTYGADPDQQLTVYTAEPGSASEQALRILASWAANECQTMNSSSEPAI